jgi:predicted dehydrogenase
MIACNNLGLRIEVNSFAVLRRGECLKIRFGLIGFGRHMSEKLIPVLKKHPSVELVYGACRTQRTLDLKKADLGLIEVTTNWLEMMSKDKIDAVIVAATPHLHELVAKKAIECGIHVFIEKPLSLSLSTIIEIASMSAHHSNIVAAEGFNFQYVGMMKKKIHFKSHEKPQRLKLHCASKGPQTSIWETNCVVKSFLYAVLIHPLSVAWFLYGVPSRIKLTHFAFDGAKLSGEVQLSYPDDQEVKLDFNNDAKCFEFEIDLTDSNGIMHLINASSHTDEKAESYETEFKEFIDSIINQNQPRNSISHSLAIYQMLSQLENLIIHATQALA